MILPSQKKESIFSKLKNRVPSDFTAVCWLLRCTSPPSPFLLVKLAVSRVKNKNHPLSDIVHARPALRSILQLRPLSDLLWGLKVIQIYSINFHGRMLHRPIWLSIEMQNLKGWYRRNMFFYQKESCVGMLNQSNIAQIHKKRKHVFKQYDGLVTWWVCFENMNVRSWVRIFGIWWSKFWLVRQEEWTNRIKYAHNEATKLHTYGFTRGRYCWRVVI